ncbi:MAG: OmpA family protein [Bacteriodetes bacterium]|nr:OmpA family protein [Bacteroidota bacterium]
MSTYCYPYYSLRSFTNSCLCIGLCFLSHFVSVAQTPDSTSTPYGAVGICVSPVIDFHKASFSELPGVPNCCPQFTSTSGLGSLVGLTWEKSMSLTSLPLIGKHIPSYITPALLSSKLYYEQSNANFLDFESTKVKVNDKEQEGKFSHELNTSISTLNLELAIGKENIWKQLSLHTGLKIGTVLSSSYQQVERIAEPTSVGVFPENNLRTRNQDSGAIPAINSPSIGMFLGASWKLPLTLDNSVYARPELFGYIPFTNNVSGIAWSTYAVRLGVSLFYVLPEYISIEPKYDTIPILRNPFVLTNNIYIKPVWLSELTPVRGIVDLRVVQKNELLSEKNVDTITINGSYETTVKPILNYVFFDVLSSDIPQRYKLLKEDEVENFSMKSLYHSGMLETYYHLLNIIAQRMREIPEAKITLTGCNMGNTVEGGKTDLSRKRAEAVRDYLVNVWKIDESRIKINARNKPAKPSFYSDVDGEEENRRVEITSNVLNLLEPVYSTDTIYTAIPNTIYVKPTNNFAGEAKTWSVTASLNKEISKEFNTGIPEQPEYEMNVEEFLKYITPSDSQFVFSYKVTDSKGASYTSKNVNVVIKTQTTHRTAVQDSVGKHIEKYNLILFDYDDASFTPLHERTLNLIRSSITPESVIYITGYTDRMGDDDYNQNLSEKRAKAVANALGLSANVHVVGIGESVILYNNSTPEGRFYSRTIEIKIEKP